MVKELRKAKFSMDFLDGLTFEGYSSDDNDSNQGWARPRFSYNEAERICAEWRKRGFNASYDSDKDCFSFEMSGDDGPEEFFAQEIAGKKLYPVGAFGWIWEEKK